MKIYLGFLGVLAVLVLGLMYLEGNYVEDEMKKDEILNDAYNVDEEAGEKLIMCADGSYDVWDSTKNVSYVCGQMVNGITP